MSIASRDIKCTSCEDDIPTGARVTIRDRVDKRGRDFLCFRCNPETQPAKIRIQMPRLHTTIDPLVPKRKMHWK